MTTKQIIKRYDATQTALVESSSRLYVKRVLELLTILRGEGFSNIHQVVSGNGTTTFAGWPFEYQTPDEAPGEFRTGDVSRLRDTFSTAASLQTVRPVLSTTSIKAILELQQLCEWIEKENNTTAVPYRVGLK